MSVTELDTWQQRLGMALRGSVGQGEAGLGGFGRWLGTARPGSARRGTAGMGGARQGTAGPVGARPGMAGLAR